MSNASRRRQGNWKHYLLPPILVLAAWQLKRTWFLLFFITLGMVAAVVVATAIPLFAEVMTTAGLRGTLRATSADSDIEMNAQGNGISTSVVQQVEGQFTPLLSQYLGKNIQLEQSYITSNDFFLSPSRQATTLFVYGTPMQQAASHLDLLQGKFASAASAGNTTVDGIEVMLTTDTAKRLQLHVGSTFPLALQYDLASANSGGQDTPSQPHTAMITARVVGLFTVPPADAAYWHGEDFTSVTIDGQPPHAEYTLLVPENALLTLYDQLNTLYHSDAIHAANFSQYNFVWHYRLDSSNLTINDLDWLITQLGGLQTTANALYNFENTSSVGTTLTYPYITTFQLSSPLLGSDNGPSILEEFQSRITVAQVPVGIFAILTLTLILFFVSLMITLLNDHQSDMVALLRSRGASSRQIFGAALLQSSALGLIALVTGMPLAIGIVLVLSRRILAGAELDTLHIITGQPLQALLGTIWYAFGIILVVLLTISFSLLFAARKNILTQRREAARTDRLPLWQRLNIDVIAGVIALVLYGFSLYLTSVGSVLQNNASVIVATPLATVAPFFLMVGCLLLLLRLLPWLLRLGVRLSGRGRSAISLLVFAQIARSPRQSLRMILLLSLAIAFALFTLTYNATEAEHIQAIITYQAGADFSGGLSASSGTSLAKDIQHYQTIPGVISASAGFVDQGNGGTANLPMDIRAVDVASFGNSVIWPSQASYQAVRPLLAKLIALRQPLAKSDIVPVIVDQSTLNKLELHVGSFFTVALNNVYPAEMNCLIVGVIDQLPTVNALVPGANGQAASLAGGVLVDYQAYMNAFSQDAQKINRVNGPAQSPGINHVWLHTKDDAVSLASVRTTLKSSEFALSNLVDRRLLLATLQSDPLYLVLDGVLGIGMVTALLLALVGTLLGAWSNARSRLVNFVTLRALGASSRQVTGILTWEQAIVYIIGLVLGGGVGVLLTLTVIPSLTFTDLNLNLSNQQLFALQSVLASKTVVPVSLPLLLLAVVIIFTLALTTMVRVVIPPALGEQLRLNQD